MASYKTNVHPRTGKPVLNEESLADISACHGRLYRILKSLSPLVRVMLRVKTPLGAENIPSHGGVVIAGNHSGRTNVAVVHSVVSRDAFYIGRIELFRGPLGIITQRLGGIPVDRSRRNSNALRYAIDVLKKGGLIVIFPEGAVNRKEKSATFRFGAVSMAHKADVPIIPMAIWRGRTMFGEPMMVGDDLEAANQKLQQAVYKMRKVLIAEKPNKSARSKK